MAYIYLITNDINGKQYVGKTYYNTIEQRWKEHLSDYKKSRCEKRPLYDAMNKYGIEHFHIEEVEYVPPEINLEEREIYWIAQYDTYNNGYNATLGGDGKPLYDYQLIVDTFKHLQKIEYVSKELNIDQSTIRRVLKLYDIDTTIGRKLVNEERKKVINQYDLNNNFIQTFDSLLSAAKFVLGENYLNYSLSGVKQHINDVCKGKRKTAYKYKWQYANK